MQYIERVVNQNAENRRLTVFPALSSPRKRIFAFLCNKPLKQCSKPNSRILDLLRHTKRCEDIPEPVKDEHCCVWFWNMDSREGARGDTVSAVARGSWEYVGMMTAFWKGVRGNLYIRRGNVSSRLTFHCFEQIPIVLLIVFYILQLFLLLDLSHLRSCEQKRESTLQRITGIVTYDNHHPWWTESIC